MYISKLQIEYAKMVTHKHPQISYVISKISACCNTKNAKMVTQSYKIGNTERGFARKNGNTEFKKRKNGNTELPQLTF